MKEKRLTLHYAVCQYIPSMFLQEKINVAMVFHLPVLGRCYVKVIQHAQRLHAFDSRFDLNYLPKLEHMLNVICNGDGTVKPKDINDDQFLATRVKADFLGVEKQGQHVVPTKYHFVFLPEATAQTDTEHYQDLIAKLEKMYL